MAGVRLLVLSLLVSVVVLLGESVHGVEVDKLELEELYRSVQSSRQDLEEIARQLGQLAEMAEADEKEALGAEEEDIGSCRSILQSDPAAASGLYKVAGANGDEVEVYCNMERECCHHNLKGWTRLGYLNMSDSTQTCPEGFREVEEPSRGCRRASTKVTCNSVTFSNPGKLPYSKVCGTVAATRHGSSDGFIKEGDMAGWEYDGISVHLRQSSTYLVVLGAPGEEIKHWFICPCKALDDPEQKSLLTFGTELKPSKFCPSSSGGGSCPAKINCCSGGSQPRFCVSLPQPTTDDIEVKLCLDQDEKDEDITLHAIELLVL